MTGSAAARPGESAEPAPSDATPPNVDDGEVRAQPSGAPVDDADGPPPRRGQRALPVVIEWLIVLVCALGLALLLKAFLVEVFVIPSGSMEPTLRVDNRVVVYKLGYRLHDVNRGDVVVFDSPDRASGVDDLIKRVVALGGETFELRDGQVHIDGTRLDEPYLEDGELTLPKAPIPGCLNEADSLRCQVPQGKVLVLGDSREDSRDSRFFGPIDADDVVGRAFLKIWPPTDIGGL